MKVTCSVIFISITLFFIYGYTSNSTGKVENAETLYLEYFATFQKELETIVKQTANWENLSLEEIQYQTLHTRNAYKRIEFLFDHHFTRYNYLHVNGGPLIKIDEYYPETPIEPNGLQTLDELVFSEGVLEQKEEINQLVKELLSAIDFVAELQQDIKLEDHILIEAIRSGLIRVFTLIESNFRKCTKEFPIRETSINVPLATQ